MTLGGGGGPSRKPYKSASHIKCKAPCNYCQCQQPATHLVNTFGLSEPLPVWKACPLPQYLLAMAVTPVMSYIYYSISLKHFWERALKQKNNICLPREEEKEELINDLLNCDVFVEQPLAMRGLIII